MAVKTRKKSGGKRVYLADEKYTGPEPTWDTERALQMDEAEFNGHLHKSLNYYNYHYGPKDVKKYVVAWMQDNEYSKQDVSDFVRSPDRMLPMTACSLVMAFNAGMPLQGKRLAYVKNTIKQVCSIVDSGDYEDETPVKNKKTTQPALVKTIQDRLQEKTNEHLGHFEGLVDELIRGNKVDPKAFEYFKANNIPQAQLSKYEEYANSFVDELKESQNTDDEDLRDAYRHLKVADYKRFYAFFDKFYEAIEAYRQVKKQTKKARVKRAPNKEKQVSKLKYMKEDNNLKLVSINPVDIIGAEELWVYNTKTRKLFKYVSDNLTGPLNVKGTSILGYDSAKSIGKTLRKPDQKLMEFMKAGKVQLRKFLDDIKATSIPANGRINNDILLLKAL